MPEVEDVAPATALSTVCKFRCEDATPFDGGVQVTLQAQYDYTLPEDRRFALYTPTGTLTTVITNPNVTGLFEVGKQYTITIAPAE